MMSNAGTLFEKKKQAITVDNVLFWFVTIDLFFLPYLSIITVSISVPIIIIWMIINYRYLFKGRESYSTLVLLFTVIISSIIGLLWDSSTLRFETDNRTTILRCFQYLICIGYYFFYKKYFSTHHIQLEKILFCFFVYVAVFALLFILFPEDYARIKIAINPADNHTRRFLSGMVFYRFNYLWTDPNNIAYLMDGLLSFYILSPRVDVVHKIVALLLVMMIIFSTASNGGLIVLLMFILIGSALWFYNGGRIKVHSLIAILIVILLFVFVARYTSIIDFINTNLIEKLLARRNYYNSTANYSGGRLNDLLESFKYFNPLFFIIGSGKEGFTTENGHFYWICMYGFPSYIALLSLFFAKHRTVNLYQYLTTIPFFIAFTVNIAIGEFKWMGIYLLFIAYLRYSSLSTNKLKQT